MRNSFGLASAFAALSLTAGPSAFAGPAVVISRDALALVTEQTNSCPPGNVIFVMRAGQVVAACDAPDPPMVVADAVATVGAVNGESIGSAAAQPGPFVPAPAPKWRIEKGSDIRESLAAWLPSDWSLAWDTPSAPLANASFEFDGEAMDAIAELFDRRSIWPDAPLTACSFPKERILQVRAAGECGAP